MKKTLFTVLFAAFSLVLKAQDAPERLDSLGRELEEQPQVEAEQQDVLPMYPGGLIQLFKFIEKHKRYRGVHGLVEVSFVIEKDGSTNEFRAVKSLSEDADQEAIRVLRKMPKWKPAMQNGEPVRFAFTMPVRF
ncbi:energy transducer TonB [Mucilaginibacter roseus]|uniref:Energy transducer TonB n=1 Tax=Mucilaginibacter roseus TaxID=1528868 RepID=A0ABS8U323_9SPHI|nr:energy transducer TonB [Mucilaginibacter roseus]MCD8739966.1 energy transducer TonB [Mucilaginibacter roseus]